MHKGEIGPKLVVGYTGDQLSIYCDLHRRRFELKRLLDLDFATLWFREVHFREFLHQTGVETGVVHLGTNDRLTVYGTACGDGPLDLDHAAQRRIREERFFIAELKLLEILSESFFDIGVRETARTGDGHPAAHRRAEGFARS